MRNLIRSLLFVFIALLSCSKEEESAPPPVPSYTVSVIAGDGGTVSSEGGTYNQGFIFNVTATPASGYRFVGWSNGETGSTLTITVNSNISITANFERITYSVDISGAITKGSYLAGSTLTFYELDDDLSQTGKSYNTEIIDDFGSYNISVKELTEDYARVVGDGFYWNEITNENTEEKLTLNAISEVKEGINVNILTHLEYPRVEQLVKTQGKTFSEAKKQAIIEVLSSLGIETSDDFGTSEDYNFKDGDEASRILLVASTIIQAERSVAEVTSLITKVANDIKDNGNIDDTELKTEIAIPLVRIDIQEVANNVYERYKEQNSELTSENFLSDYLETAKAEFNQFLPDADNDGVQDDMDVCPDTPEGEEADTSGCGKTQKQYQLTTSVEGSGSISEEVIEQPTASYDYGTTVRLTGIPSDGWEFQEWGGDLNSTENPIEITIEDEKEVTAIFVRKKFTVDITIYGEGNVQISPDIQEFEYETVIELNAVPADGWKFFEWHGDIESAENPIQLTITKNLNLDLLFKELEPDEDEDGIPDTLDLCSNTPIGEPVNSSGCAASQQLALSLDQPITFEIDTQIPDFDPLKENNESNPNGSWGVFGSDQQNKIKLDIVDNPYPNGNSSSKVLQINESPGQEQWQGFFFDLDNEILFNQPYTSISVDVYSSRAGQRVLFKLENKFNSSLNSGNLIEETKGEGWETITFNFNEEYSDLFDRLVFIMDFGVVNTSYTNHYIDNIMLTEYSGGGSGTVTPTNNPDSPTAKASDVISLFSDSYENVVVDTWMTSWSNDGQGVNAQLEEVAINGNRVKKYSKFGFVGIETASSPVDASTMTHINFDYWTPNGTVFKILLVDWGADKTYGGGDDTQHEIGLSSVTQGEWVSVSIPLSDFTQMTGKGAIAQYILVAEPWLDATYFIDNMYFSNDGDGGEIDNGTPDEGPSAPSTAPADVISLFSDSYENVAIDSWKTEWSNVGSYQEINLNGNLIKNYNNLGFVGIQFVNSQINASEMTHLNFDVWTPNATELTIKLVDFGTTGGFSGGGGDGQNDDSEGDYVFQPSQGEWVSVKMNLSEDFSGLTNTTNLAQIIIAASPNQVANIFIDNVYFSKANDSSNQNGTNIAPTVTKITPENGASIAPNADVYLTWNFEDEDGPQDINDLLQTLTFVVEIDTDASFSNPRIFNLEGKNDLWVTTSPGNAYYWRVSVSDGVDVTQDSNPFTFEVYSN